MKGSKIGAICVLAGVAAVIFALSMYIVWYGDALLYQFSFATGEPVRGAGDIPASMWHHFFNQNGRIVAHAIVQVFCGIAGQWPFAACNALVYAVLILLMMKYAGERRLTVKMTLAASLLTLFFCDTSYIPPHQIGYIWMACTAVGFLLVYERGLGSTGSTMNSHISHSSHSSHSAPGAVSALECALLFVFGWVCGNGNEAIDLGIGAALCIDMAARYLRKSEISVRRIMLLGGFCLGVAVLCLSPGQMGNAAHSYRPPLPLSLFNLVVSLRAFWVFAAVLAVACARRKVRLRGFVADNRVLFIAMAAMFAFNLAITVKGNRQLFGVELYSALLTLRLLRTFSLSWGWLAAGFTVVAAQYYMKFTALSDFNRDESELRRQLVARGNAPLYIDLLHHNPYVHPIEELSYHDCVNLTFHVAACADDIHGRGNFYSRHVNYALEHIDSVALYPKAIARLGQAEPRNRVVYCGNGVYMMLRLKERPARFVLHRSLDIAGFRYPLSPVEISFDASQHPSTELYDVFVTSFPYPLMHADSVTIE